MAKKNKEFWETSFEEFSEYFDTHTEGETAEHFGVSRSSISRYRQKNGYHKDKSKIEYKKLPKKKDRLGITLDQMIIKFEELANIEETANFFELSEATLRGYFSQIGYDYKKFLRPLSQGESLINYLRLNQSQVIDFAKSHRKIEVAKNFGVSMMTLSRFFSEIDFKMPMANSSIYCHETKKINGSYLKSQDEEAFYTFLTSKYGQNQIIRQYSDSRYNYKCDFYIKSLDVFLEINCCQTHYFYPYTDLDIELISDFKLKDDWVSRQRVKIWGGSDVKKLNLAKENNLNYFMIYPTKTYRNIDSRLYSLYRSDSYIGEYSAKDAVDYIDQSLAEYTINAITEN